MAVIEPLIKVKSVNIDFPFVQPGDRKIDGQLATSFSTVKEMIDRAIQLGFNTISFDTNVPINAQTGELQLTVSGSTNGDKTFPQAVWEGVAYAESKGLKTILDLNIRNALNDEPIMTGNVGSGFSKSIFFNTVKEFETTIASKANQYGVDGIRIGSFNFGYVTSEYSSDWVSVINSIRSVYKGTLGYQSNLEDTNNSLWGLVDEVQILINTVSPLKSYYTKNEIAPLYLGPYIMGNGVLSQESIFSKIKTLANKYPDKLLSIEASFQPGQSAGRELADIWSYVFAADPLLENAKDKNSLVPYPESLIDPILNQQKIAGFFEFFSNYLKDIVSGVQYYQFAPWTEASWIKNPQTLNGQVWLSVIRAGLSLNYSPESQQTIAQYLLRDWGFSTLHYGTIKNDVMHGSELDDKFFATYGSDVFTGEKGLDSLLIEDKSSNYKLSNKFSHWLLEKNQGQDKLVGIERVIFADKQVALDIDGTAGQAYRVYQAAFNRTPDNGGLKYWIGLMDGGVSLPTVSSAFIASAEFKTLYGSNPTNELFVSKLYDNVLHRTPDAGGYNYWVGLLNTNKIDNISTLINFSESTENQAGVIGVIQNGIELLN
jgi:hypothetical protein